MKLRLELSITEGDLKAIKRAFDDGQSDAAELAEAVVTDWLESR